MSVECERCEDSVATGEEIDLPGGPVCSTCYDAIRRRVRGKRIQSGDVR